MRDPRNIVVCCDGTANEFKKDRTNVVKLFQTLVKDPDTQVCYYHPGVGTMAAPGFVTRIGAKIAEIAGLAFGYGLSNDICDAYTFISRNFQAGDKLYLFGFSRGAYTARALASLLRMYGLLWKDNDRLVLYAVRMMWAIRRLQRKSRPGSKPDPRIAEYFRLAAEFKSTFSRECKPHFVGVWDTVSSVGWFSHPLSLPYTANNPDIAIGRHAVALDERRAFFRTNLWRPDPDPDKSGPKDVKQVWFPGVHCDVGGGYAEPESGLAKIPLKWMLDEARESGLRLNEEKVALVLGARKKGWAKPDPDGKLHDSMTSAWRLTEYVPKPHWDGQKTTWRANRFRRRTLPPGSWIDDAAWVRNKGQYQESLPTSAVRRSLADAARDGRDLDLPTGKLNVLLEKHNLVAHITSAVVARIQRLIHATETKERSEMTYERDLAIPAGADEPRTLDVAPGRYRVQAFLPSGSVLQTERVVAPDESVDVRLRGEPAEREWLSWQRFAGAGPDPSALRERPPIRRRGVDPGPEGLSGLMRELVPALRRPWRLDWTSVKYLARRSLRMLVSPLVDLAASLLGSRRRASLREFDLPVRGSYSWEMLPDRRGPELPHADTHPGFFGVVGPMAPDGTPLNPIPPEKQEGALRLWHLQSHSRREADWCRPFLMKAHDTIEIALVPTHWIDIKTQRQVRVEALADESKRRVGARLCITVRDSSLGGLLAYLGRGNWAAMRILLRELHGDELLTQTTIVNNPLPVCAVLYAAWALSDPDQYQRWEYLFASLSHSEPTRPSPGSGPPADAKLLRALWQISRAPDPNEVDLTALKSAYHHGIPCFSAGVFLLRDTLARYRDRDEEANRMFERVAKLATRVDPGQVFTVIRYPIT